MKIIRAIDPGPTQSAIVSYYAGHLGNRGILPNDKLLTMLRGERTPKVPIVVEMIASYGMPVGREVFETCVWIGRFVEANLGVADLIYRKDVKLHLCGNPRAKDANIRQALIDRFGGSTAIGTKKEPGPLYGMKGDLWAALAVAVTYADTKAGESE